ncbi:MAG: alpha/beta fold hydrolase, partial [Planctomycetes bacterium]|nr:alpha/beta fold hydrolase [Planctomycetota bacterium]
MQPKFLYKPVKEMPYSPAELGLDYEKVTLTTSDNVNLTSWYIPSDRNSYTVLFCHGNGGNIMHRLDSLNMFYQLGLNCFIFDYRGYGTSQGKPSEEGTYLDAAAAYQWLIKEKSIPPEKIIIFGRSLGGSIAAQLASKGSLPHSRRYLQPVSPSS